ncbi:MAG: sensor domain-containing diguanylate cyclase [Proteobacteria bacterium]|nr:sensor domain-containing diguanylate cyclase [Pseudomonadota bacterium]
MTKSKEEKKAFIITRDSDFRDALASGLDELSYKIIVHKDASNAFSELENELTTALVIIDRECSNDNTDSEIYRLNKKCCTSMNQIVVQVYNEDNHKISSVSASKADFFMFKPVNPELLRCQLLAADKHRYNLLELMEIKEKAEIHKKELVLMEQQHEDAFSRANTLTVESEISRLELDQIFKTVAGCIMLIDKDCNVIRANDAISKVTGLTRIELQGKKCFETSICGCCNTPKCPFARIQGGEARVEIEIQKTLPDGEIAHYIIIATPLRTFGPEFVGIVTFLTDITDRVKAEKSLIETKEALKISEEKYKQLSIVDDLTGLFNKRCLDTQLEGEISRALRYGRPLSLLLMDIDNFKTVNDTYGHSQGDKVLAGLAQVLRSCIRDSDLAFRYGGEEFVVILPETSVENSTKVAERIRQSCASFSFSVNSSEEFAVTLSIGCTQYVPCEKQQAFVSRADKHMYCAKNEGKNRVICDNEG